MGLIAGFVRAVFFSAVVGTAGYTVGHGIGYDAGRRLQRERDARIVARDRAETALRLEGIATRSYAQLRSHIRKEFEKPVNLSDERYESLIQTSSERMPVRRQIIDVSQMK